MSEKKNNNLVLGLAAAGVVVGAALLFHWANTTPEGEVDEVTPEDIMAELKEEGLDVVKKKGVMIDTEYFLKLLQYIGKHTRDRTKTQRGKLVIDRRALYKADKWD